MSSNGVLEEMAVHSHHAERYVQDINEEIVAETNFEGDKYNMGKILLKALEKCPHEVNQIDAANDSKETNGQLRARVLACARALNAVGVKKGDVLAIIGRNHLDVCVPYFAGLVSGVPVLQLDSNLTSYQLKKIFGISKPVVVFCDSNKTSMVCEVLQELLSSSIVVAFPHGGCPSVEPVQRFDDFLAAHLEDDQSFALPTFNTKDTVALLICTSGTTGTPKQVELTHYNLFVQLPFIWSNYRKFPQPTRMILNFASIHWTTGILLTLHGTVFNVTRVQTSAEMTAEHIFHIINKYKPTFGICGPTLVYILLKHPRTNDCDLSSYEMLYVGGAAVGKELMIDLRKRISKGIAKVGYALTETSGTVFAYAADTPILSAGKPIPVLQHKLIDSNEREILEYNKPGELLVKGGCVFKGYYKDEEATKKAFTSDGFFRTGDLFYRNEANNYFFVERLKMLIKYKSYHISPQEVEQVIMTHPGVAVAAVCGIPHEEDGEHPAACVVRSAYDPPVTAQPIKDLVKKTLSPNNKLRGGVLFLEQIPLTPSGKLDRPKIKQIALGAIRE